MAEEPQTVETPRPITKEEVVHNMWKGYSPITFLAEVADRTDAKELCGTAFRVSALSALDVLEVSGKDLARNDKLTYQNAWREMALARALIAAGILDGTLDITSLKTQLVEWQEGVKTRYEQRYGKIGGEVLTTTGREAPALAQVKDYLITKISGKDPKEKEHLVDLQQNARELLNIALTKKK